MAKGIEFDFPEDCAFFEALLCQPGESLQRYAELFDLRPPVLKRREFNQRREQLLSTLIEAYGQRCLLGYSGLCNLHSGLAVDHLIPLSSNKLNKELRHLAPEPGKKVSAQSFGSNDIHNLILACNNCNGHKKHRFLESDRLRTILELKYGLRAV
jgi:5-methylcytosine-specific restriction endonuclease McrA